MPTINKKYKFIRDIRNANSTMSNAGNVKILKRKKQYQHKTIPSDIGLEDAPEVKKKYFEE